MADSFDSEKAKKQQAQHVSERLKPIFDEVLSGCYMVQHELAYNQRGDLTTVLVRLEKIFR